MLAAHQVVKRYESTLALAGVDFAVAEGEIVGLAGANGAGKSTLISILSGATAPSEGSVLLDGVPVHFASPLDAARSGVATVVQDVDAAIVPTATVAENLVLDRLAEGSTPPLLTRAHLERLAASVLGGAAVDLPLRALASSLSTSQKQELLIARALHRGARVLILDEPTAALSVSEQRTLHERLRMLARGGTGIIYITHHLDELRSLCDSVTVIRDGRVAWQSQQPFTVAQIVPHMLGGLAVHDRAHPAQALDNAATVLEVTGLCARPGSDPVDLTVREGEVLVVTGVLGAGKTELLRQIAGADRPIGGSIMIDGAAARLRSRARAVRSGVGFVPEDRRVQAEIHDFDVAENSTIAALRRFSVAGLLVRRRERAATTRLIAEVGIVAPGPRAALSSLSGGNRQKVVVGRWLLAGARVLVLDEPFRGVDLGARADLGRLLRSGRIAASLVATSDAEEALEVADRILVLVDGAIVAEVDPQRTSVEQLTAIMLGVGDDAEHTPAPSEGTL